MKMTRPNILFILADQLRAASTPLGDGGVQGLMPNLESLAKVGVNFTNAISSCPLCTPYRAMLLTGRYPQSTGHVVNFIETRHDEISFADTFASAGYRTGWIGKWHLGAGEFPKIDVSDPEPPIPEGRSRLGFEYFRAYNFHSRYFDGWIGLECGKSECWKGYETEGLLKYAFEFLDRKDERPFCLFVSPHQPHLTNHPPFVPEKYYQRVPGELHLPPNVAEKDRPRALEMQRHYLAMIAAVDDMLGELLRRLDRNGKTGNTVVVFTSDHGTMGGAHGFDPWCKKLPYEESIRIPLVASFPGVLACGKSSDALVSPVDLLPTLGAFCGVSVPGCVEGADLSGIWRGDDGAFEQEAVLTMNFTGHPDFALPEEDPAYRPHYEPWRGIRTKTHHLIRWFSGREALYDLKADPFQMRNLAGSTEAANIQAHLEYGLDELLKRRGDRLLPSETYVSWIDSSRRIVRNSHGQLNVAS